MAAHQASCRQGSPWHEFGGTGNDPRRRDVRQIPDRANIQLDDTNALVARTVEVLRNIDVARRTGERGMQRIRGLFSLLEQARQTVNLFENVRSNA